MCINIRKKDNIYFKCYPFDTNYASHVVNKGVCMQHTPS